MRTNAVVIGAGHAGLAMSRRLTERSIDHVVLERGGVADSWRTKRWPGLRLLTPNWMLGLPGQAAGQPDPDGFLAAAEVADMVAGHHQVRVLGPGAGDAPVDRDLLLQRVVAQVPHRGVAANQLQGLDDRLVGGVVGAELQDLQQPDQTPAVVVGAGEPALADRL